jgi:hypothetical protein
MGILDGLYLVKHIGDVYDYFKVQTSIKDGEDEYEDCIWTTKHDEPVDGVVGFVSVDSGDIYVVYVDYSAKIYSSGPDMCD